MNTEKKSEIENRFKVGKKYLRAKEVAEYVGIGLSTVWYYASKGKLTPKHLSKRVTVFSINEVEKLIHHDEAL